MNDVNVRSSREPLSAVGRVLPYGCHRLPQRDPFACSPISMGHAMLRNARAAGADHFRRGLVGDRLGKWSPACGSHEPAVFRKRSGYLVAPAG